MSNANYGDTAQAKLRAIVAVMEQEMLVVPPTPALRAAWVELVQVLALGAAPQTRECPTCKSVGLRAASRCSNCWAALEKLPDLGALPPAGDA